MNKEICKCGHEKISHSRPDGSCVEGTCYANFQCCKKFEPQDDKQLYEDTLGIPFDRKPKNHSPQENSEKNLSDVKPAGKSPQGNSKEFLTQPAGTLSSKRLCNYECLKKFDLPFYPEKDIKDFIQKILESTCLRACDICSKNIKTRAGSDLI